MPRIRLMIKFITESRIDAPAEQIFAFLDNPASLPQLFPPQERVRTTKRQEGLISGGRLILVLYGGFMPARWELETTKLEAPLLFEQTMVHGPFRHWRHRCRLMPDGKDGTLVRDTIEFQVRGGWLGWFFGRRRARRRLRRIFDHRHTAILKAITGRTYENSELRYRGEETGAKADAHRVERRNSTRRGRFRFRKRSS